MISASKKCFNGRSTQWPAGVNISQPKRKKRSVFASLLGTHGQLFSEFPSSGRVFRHALEPQALRLHNHAKTTECPAILVGDSKMESGFSTWLRMWPEIPMRITGRSLGVAWHCAYHWLPVIPRIEPWENRWNMQQLAKLPDTHPVFQFANWNFKLEKKTVQNCDYLSLSELPSSLDL